jgi:ribose-phosphate pyrophosphokinase
VSRANTPAAELLIVGNTSDDSFAIDVAFGMGQTEDIADLISLKSFANSEFCPRFISDEHDLTRIGDKLHGRRVVIVSTSDLMIDRQSLAMRNLLIARAARENGAAEVTLLEPDLFYSAQDRGPRQELGATGCERSVSDLKKFDGQPFSARLYAQMLKLAGVDRVVTVHNHSTSVQAVGTEVFDRGYTNLVPDEIYIDYLRNSNIIDCGEDGEGLALCAPDRGARNFVRELHAALGLPRAKLVLLHKVRRGERDVEIDLDPESESSGEDLGGHDIVLLDDMVRTGSTVVEACQFLRRFDPGRIVFAVTHFYASEDGRAKMAHPSIDEILTLNTIPTVLNRDVQGRLRRKMVVLKIERWLARNLCEILGTPAPPQRSLYQIDMSSKNRRFQRQIWLNDELRELPNPPIGRTAPPRCPDCDAGPTGSDASGLQ